MHYANSGVTVRTTSLAKCLRNACAVCLTLRMETENPTIATAYLPQVTRRFGGILSAETKLPKGAVTYLGKSDGPIPEGATPTSWALHTDDAVAAFRRLGAVVVPA